MTTPTRRHQGMTAEQRFALCVKVREDGCWEWTGFVDPGGYGRMGYQGRRSVLAHVIAWELHRGPKPDGTELDHVCHTTDTTCAGGKSCLHRRCVNPDHLEPVTHDENARRGRSFTTVNAAKTHCPQGHEYAGDNVFIVGKRSRACRICARESGRRHRAMRLPLPDWLAS